MVATRQPFLHDAVVLLQAPAQAWCRADGGMRTGIDGLYVSDVRVVRDLEVQVAGSDLEHVRTASVGADRARITDLLRGLDDDDPDPKVRLDRERVVGTDGMTETLVLTTALDRPVEVDLAVSVVPDLTSMSLIRHGVQGEAAQAAAADGAVRWSGDAVAVELAVTGLETEVLASGVLLRWRTTVPPRGRAEATWTVRAHDTAAVVRAPQRRVPLAAPETGDPELDRWLRVALGDLEALQLALPDAPDEVFVAAGAPWFFTLFGRDSIWAARMLLPVDTAVAHGTLTVLARLQGRHHDPVAAEDPGKIIHELRRETLPLGDGGELPTHYYGTIDATPLWVLLLHDAWRAGLPDAAVRELLPALHAALGWLRASVPPDGFLAYEDETGRGLTNQGWKDSGDGVQWRDGRLARAPIALCEAQAYAHEAALAAVVLLTAFGEADAAAEWAGWADALRRRFRDAFWVDDADGGHPAIALDADGHAVEGLTSNIGHLLGSGLLDAADERRVAALLVDPRLDSGVGLRTLATDAAGYWPLGYHAGSVWAHDTAIAVHGLQRAGFVAEARALAAGLLRAAASFGFRMPELFGADGGPAPVPYPAACRPQAWSAAAAVVVRAALDPANARGSASAPAAPPSTDRRRGEPSSVATSTQ